MSLPTKEDISVAIESSGAIKAPELEGYYPVPGIIGPESYSGGFCIVFPFVKGQDKKAVRIWHQEIDNIQERYKLLSKDTKHCCIKSIIGIEYIERGLTVGSSEVDLTLMDWIEGKPLKEYISSIITSSRSDDDKKKGINAFADELEDIFKKMHSKGFSHGDLQHDNILVTISGSPRFIDYDSFYTPSMGTSYPQTTSGYNGYQHPSRFKRQYVSNEKSDYFSELILVLSLRAIANDLSLWNITADLDYSLILTPKDFNDIQSSSTCQRIRAIGDEKCNHLLEILVDYLKKDSIDDLESYDIILASPTKKEREEYRWRKAKLSKKISVLDDFIRDFPNSKHISEAKYLILRLKEENRLWKEVKEQDSVASYKHYLNLYKDGQYASVAKKRLDELIKKRRAVVIVAISSVVVTIIVCFLIVKIIVFPPPPPPPPPPGPPKPTHVFTREQIIDLEKRTENIIRAMELVKDDGDLPNLDFYIAVPPKLDSLKLAGSKRYWPLKRRYDTL